MNQNILKKAIDELKKEKPEIQYVLGMLETLCELQAPVFSGTVSPKQTNNTSEAEVMDAKARAAINIVKKITEESTLDVK